MGSLSEKKLQKKLSLLDAACDLFLEKGVNITAIDEIVKRAGVAKGTFYLYFKDKYDILDQIVLYKGTAIFEESLSELRKKCAVDGKISFDEQMCFYTDYIIDYMKAHKELVALIRKNLSMCLGLVLDKSEESGNNSFSFIFDEFASRGFDRDETKKMLYLITNMISSACCEAILSADPYSIEDLRPQIHAVIHKMVA